MVRRVFLALSIISIAAIILVSIYVTPIWWLFIIVLPIVAVGLYDMIQTKHAIRTQDR